jgi:hypothetical protein
MTRRRRSSLPLSGDQARDALAVLVHDGKVAAGEVQKALKRHRHLVSDLRASLSALETGVGSLGKRLFGDRTSRKARKARTATRKVARRKPKISEATRAKYRLQGKYLSALRNLSKGARAKVKAIRKKSGVLAAIAVAKRKAD